MNVKQAAGWFLLLIMLMITYGLFGGGSIGEQKPVVQPLENVTVNETTPVIKAYTGPTFEEQAGIDLGCIGLMVFLIIIRTLLIVPDVIYPEKGSKEELEELTEEETHDE